MQVFTRLYLPDLGPELLSILRKYCKGAAAEWGGSAGGARGGVNIVTHHVAGFISSGLDF